MLNLRLKILLHSLATRPLAALVASLLSATVAILGYQGTLAFLKFLSNYPFAARAVEVRSLEGLFLVLSAAVLLSALPGALSVLYDSRDLPLLLAWPIPASRIFAFKVLETFATTALVPTLLTLPVLYALGAYHAAHPAYYLIATATTLGLYALPVGLGVALALPLVRFAPAGRAREWAGAVSAVLGGAMVYGLRALRPEALIRQEFASETALVEFIRHFQNPSAPFLPSAWAARAVEAALAGVRLPAPLALLLTLAVGVLLVSSLAAGFAYQAGWVRGLEGASVLRRARPPSLWERLLARLGPVGALWIRDLRLFVRDPNQVAQLMLVFVLILLYITSLAAIPLEGAVFVKALGFMHLAFQGLVIAGVGVRLAYPLYSFEGPGYWIVDTGPVSHLGLLLSRYALALLLLLPLGIALGWYAPSAIGLVSELRTISLISALASVVGLAALGVGLGAIWPNRQATNASEIPMSLGGMLYMLLGTIYAIALAVLDTRPVYWAISGHGGFLNESEGLLWLTAVLALTLVITTTSLSLAHLKSS